MSAPLLPIRNLADARRQSRSSYHGFARVSDNLDQRSDAREFVRIREAHPWANAIDEIAAVAYQLYKEQR